MAKDLTRKEKGILADKIVEHVRQHIQEELNELLEARGDDNKVNCGVSIEIEIPEDNMPGLKTTLKWSEKHSHKLEETLADPDQADMSDVEGSGVPKPGARKKKS